MKKKPFKYEDWKVFDDLRRVSLTMYNLLLDLDKEEYNKYLTKDVRHVLVDAEDILYPERAAMWAKLGNE